MKIYFAGSIRGGREDTEIYFKIINYLKNYGQVLTEHIGKKDLDSFGEKGLSDKEIHNRDLEWILESDMVVAEVTKPSLGVGYEIAKADENDKKVLCLYRPQKDKKLSAMISGSLKLINREYNNFEEAKEKIDDFFKSNF